MNEREVFQQAISDNPRDITVRRIFADWLDLNDEPELADFHRQWTVEKYDEARNSLQDFAEYLDQEAAVDSEIEGVDLSPRLTVEGFVQAMQKRMQKGEGGISLRFETPSQCWKRQSRMWECYELITGQKVAAFVKEDYFFRCGC